MQREFDEQTPKRLNQALLLSTKRKILREQNMVFWKCAICVISKMYHNWKKKYKYVASSNPGPILLFSKTIKKTGIYENLLSMLPQNILISEKKLNI